MSKKRNKQLYDYRKYEGTDESLEVSLFEYGLIWKIIDGDYKFIYGVNMDKLVMYTTFDHSCFPVDTDIYEEFGWVDWDSFFKYLGTCKEKYESVSFPQKVFDLMLYYGRLNVFGDASNPYPISGITC